MMIKMFKDVFLSLPTSGFLCVRPVQAERKTFYHVANSSEERPGSSGRHQREKQPSHHGIEGTAD